MSRLHNCVVGDSRERVVGDLAGVAAIDERDDVVDLGVHAQGHHLGAREPCHHVRAPGRVIGTNHDNRRVDVDCTQLDGDSSRIIAARVEF